MVPENGWGKTVKPGLDSEWEECSAFSFDRLIKNSDSALLSGGSRILVDQTMLSAGVIVLRQRVFIPHEQLELVSGFSSLKNDGFRGGLLPMNDDRGPLALQKGNAQALSLLCFAKMDRIQLDFFQKDAILIYCR